MKVTRPISGITNTSSHSSRRTARRAGWSATRSVAVAPAGSGDAGGARVSPEPGNTRSRIRVNTEARELNLSGRASCLIRIEFRNACYGRIPMRGHSVMCWR